MFRFKTSEHRWGTYCARAAVLQLGRGVHDIHDEPLIELLVQAGQPWRVLDAWLRLERYFPVLPFAPPYRTNAHQRLLCAAPAHRA